MRNEEVDVVHGEPGLVHDPLERRRHRLGCEAEDRAAVHPEVVQPLVDDALRDGDRRPGGRRDNRLPARAVRAQLEAAHAAGRLRRLEDDRARAVAEEDARRPVLEVEVFRDRFRTDQQDRPVGPALDKLLRRDEAVDEARAADLERHRAAVRFERVLDLARRRRGEVVRARRRDEDQVEVLAREACTVERPASRFDAEVARGLVLGREVALLDARARLDPLVGRVDDLREVVVRDDVFGGVVPPADKRGVEVRHSRSGERPGR